MLLGNKLNAALLWPHAPALSIFINLLNNLFFPHYLNTCESLLSHWLSMSDFQTQQTSCEALMGDEEQPEGSREEEIKKSRGGCSYFPLASQNMKMSKEIEIRKRKAQ